MVVRRSDLHSAAWRAGRRVSREVNERRREFGTIIESDGKLKVRWDSGRTSYYLRGELANLKLKKIDPAG